MDIEFNNRFCPAKPSRDIAVKPLNNLWYVCRGKISDVAINISVCHDLTDSNHSVGMVTNGDIFTDSKRTG